MGDIQPSVRTLPTGEKVTHYPDGTQVMLPRNSLSDALDANSAEQETASAALRDALVAAATTKREALADGNPVPSDKRVV